MSEYNAPYVRDLALKAGKKAISDIVEAVERTYSEDQGRKDLCLVILNLLLGKWAENVVVRE